MLNRTSSRLTPLSTRGNVNLLLETQGDKNDDVLSKCYLKTRFFCNTSHTSQAGIGIGKPTYDSRWDITWSVLIPPNLNS